jgi:MFS transporter, putative metabolite:H+ symporter
VAIPTAAELAARLDRLPMTRHIWVLVTLISLCGGFELYDLSLTAYIAPGLLKAGYFTSESLGPFSVLTPYGIAGIGTFVFALFAGLFDGAIFLGHFADRYGRRSVFTFLLIWYSVTTAIMAFQTSDFGVNLWRFIAGIGIGIELVTIDTYISELVPCSHRGRAYAFNQFFQFLAVPFVASLAWLLVPHAPLGFDGWRWVVLIGSAGAILIWFIRLSLPESPRWLARHGRLADAERVVDGIERRVASRFHSYQSELFPTRIRSRAIGFVYSWSRLSAALSGLVVAFLLHLGGVNAVFGFIAFAMAIVVITIGGFGPRTRGLALEAIAH